MSNSHKRDRDYSTQEPAQDLPTTPGTLPKSLQYDLFCTFHGEPADLSNTVELWDAIPKYVVTARKQAWAAVKKERLPLYRQQFNYTPQPRETGRVQHLVVTIAPARFEEAGADGVPHEVEAFPSAAEEMIEEAIRKIFADQINGGLDAKTARVYFTLGMVHRELKARGKTRSYNEILRSLRIMTACNITITPATGGRALVSSPIFFHLAGVSRKDWLADPESRFMVILNELMHTAITNLSFRQLNYKTLMSLKSPLARWIFKRLSHEYINAGLMAPYSVYMSSLARDSGMLTNAKLHRNAATLDAALTELEDAKVILGIRKDRVEPTGKSPDYHYALTPNPRFIADVKAANSRTNAMTDTARARGLTAGTLDTGVSTAKSASAPARPGVRRGCSGPV
jgi:hypothetical protein